MIKDMHGPESSINKVRQYLQIHLVCLMLCMQQPSTSYSQDGRAYERSESREIGSWASQADWDSKVQHQRRSHQEASGPPSALKLLLVRVFLDHNEKQGAQALCWP